MRSLLVRIFLSFWLIIVITIGIAALGGYYYSERMRQAVEDFEISETILAASTALEAEGRTGLEAWLADLPSGYPATVFVLDQKGRDILGRTLPRRVTQMIRRFGRHRDDRRHHPREPPNLRPARPLTQLVGPDQTIYTLFVVPKRSVYGQWINEWTRPLMLLLALLVSAIVSYLLARAITRPVHRFREATVSIAEGHLATRVADSMGKRRDEIGLLAHDFDTMADKLQHASDQQVELSRNISHELRSPLARMRVALELARRQAGEMPEFARIETETERLDNLIGQILSYSRLDSRNHEAPSIINLPDLIYEVVENVRFECRSDGIGGVTVQFDQPDRLDIQGFASPLTSAMENILRNAVYHSPKEGVVSVNLESHGKNAIIVVEDQGPGVPAVELEKLFEPFYRTRDAAANQDLRGTGLGLAIAKRAIQKHFGFVSASNASGGGLRMEITIPLSPELA